METKVERERARRVAVTQRLLARLAKADVTDMEIAYYSSVHWRTVFRWRNGATPRVAPFRRLQRFVEKKLKKGA